MPTGAEQNHGQALDGARRPDVLIGRLVGAIALLGVGALAGCASSAHDQQRDAAGQPHEQLAPPASDRAPERFTIVPDDYHVPYAGTAEDGRKFFLSDELFTVGGGGSSGAAYVGLFLWHADGTFDEVRVHKVPRPGGLPPAQARSAGRKGIVDAELAELGDYVLEPIKVEPFTEKVGGVTFGWKVGHYGHIVFISILPGDFIAYYAPWDGLDYDT